MALSRLGKYCGSLLRESSKGVFCDVLQPGWIERCAGAKRHLLSEDVIKLQNFQQKKLALAHRVIGSKENYIEQFSEKLQRNELIMQDELKLLLHLCESADDMLIVRDAIYRYHAENQNTALEFKFGPVFMRLCYELGLEKLAADTLNDKTMEGFFTDATSFNILMDMLFTKGSYENALEVIRTMKKQDVSFSKDTYILASGICYKLNTPESYTICTVLLEEAQVKGYHIPKRAYCFAVALALRQNDTGNAQSLFSQIMSIDSRLCQNLKVVLLTMSGAMTDAISILSESVLSDGPSFVKKLEISQEVVDLLHFRSKDGPQMMAVKEIVSKLEQTGQLTQKTLDEMLCHTPSGKRKQALIMDKRRTHQRALTPQKSTLLSD